MSNEKGKLDAVVDAVKDKLRSGSEKERVETAKMVLDATSAPQPEHLVKAPAGKHMRKWGMKEYPSNEFVRVTFLVTGSLSGVRFTKGKSGDVPKAVFESTLKPLGQAKLWEKPKPKPVAVRPGTDVGAFRRR